MKVNSNKTLYRLILSSLFLTIALLLPLLTGQIQQIGNMLCPMHIPVLICAYFCGPVYAIVIGFIAPILRFLLFGMPPIIPTGIAMCFELATYGFIAGVLYLKLSKNKINIYISLITSMIIGRVIWGFVMFVISKISGSEFGLEVFYTSAILNALPGIVIQIVFIPIIVMLLKNFTIKA